MKNYPIFISFAAVVFLFNTSSEVHAQPNQKHDISGYVIDAETGKPLQAANVFLANTMLGDASNELGYFIIRGVPPGTFEIVVSFIGYDVLKREIRVTGPTNTMVFELTPRPLQAPEIEVTAEDLKEWRKRFKKITELFFSTTRNASECEILNPYVLDFAEADGVFKAMADEPLIIENRALGYKLLYVLEDFEDTPDFLKVRGIPKFEELTPKTPQEAEKWQANRLRAYRGSLRHFLATLCKNYDTPIEDHKQLKKIRAINERNLFRTTRAKTIESISTLEERDYLHKMARVIYEGFNVLQFDENPSATTNRTIEGKFVNTNLFLEAGDLPHERWLRFPGYLHVTYTKELEEYSYVDYLYEDRTPNDQQSFFKLNTPKLLIDTSGHFYNRYGLTIYGYWAWERIADMLPYEYRVEENPMN